MTDLPGEMPGSTESDDIHSGGMRVLDLLGLVVGYALAALAVRALWPAGVTPRGPTLIVVFLFYGWLGLAMSGPFVLLRRTNDVDKVRREVSRPPKRARIGQPLELRPEPPPRYSRAESAWLLIGGYWIAAAVLVLPTRIPSRSAPILGLLPFVAVGILWPWGLAERSRGRASRSGPTRPRLRCSGAGRLRGLA